MLLHISVEVHLLISPRGTPFMPLRSSEKPIELG